MVELAVVGERGTIGCDKGSRRAIGERFGVDMAAKNREKNIVVAKE